MTIIYDTDMNADFSDLRFTDDTNTAELDYWIENFTTSVNASVWVEMPLISASGITSIYMYYKNPAALTASNGNNTFLFFEDWLTNPCLPDSKYVNISSPNVVCANSIMTFTGEDSTNFKTDAMFGKGYAERTRHRTTKTNGDAHIGFATAYPNTNWVMFSGADNSNDTQLRIGGENYYKLWEEDGLWHTYDIAIVSASSTLGRVDGINQTLVNIAVTLPMGVWFNSNTGQSFQNDWFLVRNYTSKEPSVVIGAEELPLTNAPSLGSLNCSNGTSYKAGFDWNEPITNCQVACTDQDEGDSLYVNFSIKSIQNEWTNLQNTTNISGFWHYDFSSFILNNYTGSWNVTALCSDYTTTNSTTINWDLVNTAPDTPAPERTEDYIFNMTTEVNVSALYTDAEGHSGVCYVNVSKEDIIQFSANFSIEDDETCSYVIEPENFTGPGERWSAKFQFYDGFDLSAVNSTNWTVQLWQEIGGGGGDPLCVQYLQVDSFTGLTINYNLTVQCVNSKADANYSTVTITPYADFGGVETISVLANSTNQISFYNVSSRGTSDGGAYTIDGAVITENITMTTNAIKHFIPIDPPYAFTKDGIIDCDQGMYVNKNIALATPITLRGAGEFLISALLSVKGLNKGSDCTIAINESGRLEVNL
jgi:hypothetical protein